MSDKNLSTNFNVSPYYDDYDENKKFLRILFRPGYPIQARELTQLQTIINNQVSRFGESIYEDGSVVTGLNFSLTDNTYLKLEDTVTWDTLSHLIVNKSFGENYQVNDEVILTGYGADQVIVRIGALGSFSFNLINQIVPAGFFGQVLSQNYNVSSGAQGIQFEVNVKVTTTADPAEDALDDREERPTFLVQGFTTLTPNDPPTLFGKYLSGTEFKEGDALSIWDEENETTTVSIGTLPADFSGDTQLASIDRGVLFTNGFFVLANRQSIPIEKYRADGSARVGLGVEEDIVTEQDDPTLLDNAAGSPNENAPGAHRFAINLTLEARTLRGEDVNVTDDEESDVSFYELSRVVGGEIVDRKEKPNYSVLGDTMAQNIYDVNGNFIIEPFKVTFDDKLLFNLTVDPSNPHTQGSDTLNVIVEAVDPIITLEPSSLIGRIFEVDEIPYLIENAINTSGNNYTLTLVADSVPDFVKFEDNSVIEIIDKETYQASFTPGSAYVNGRKFSTLGTTKRDIEKTRTAAHVETETNKLISASFGNYLVLNFPTTALAVADFDIGSVFDLHADVAGTDTKVGTARVKQFKRTVNSKMEMYFFGAKFDQIALTGISGTSGTSTISGSAFESRYAGATFTYNSTRYKIISVNTGTNEATLATPLVEDLTGVDITLNYTASTIKSIRTSSTSTLLDVASSVISDLNEDGYAETRLLETDKTKLIFKASGDITKSLADVQYRYLKESIETVGLDSTIPITLDADEQLWIGADNNEFFIQVVNLNGLTPGASVGDIVPASGISSTEFGGNINLVSDIYDGTDVIVSYPVVRSSANQLTTNFVFGNTVEASAGIISGSTSIDGPNGHVRLPASVITRPNVDQTIGLTGVFRLKAIYELDTADPNATILDPENPDFAHTIVTSDYTLENGQRDESVDHATIRLRSGRPLPTNPLLVIVDRITTNPSGDRTFYSVDSYDERFYDYLPKVYTSNGDVFDLRSSIDFRPRATELPFDVNFETYVDSDKTFDQQIFPPHAENASVIGFDVDYYVARMDKVMITPDLDFRIVKGIPAESPSAPNDIDRSITLYDIYQHPYSSGKNDIETIPYNHSRYTMKKVAELDQRIMRIEKTIQLDKVQKSILAAEVSNESNVNLLKTGVLVDSFSNTDVADVSNPDFKASIDIQNSQMRPSFDQYTMSLELDVTDINTTVTKTEDGIILGPYDDNSPATFVEQTLATRTENLNPFAIIDWLGEIHLVPEKDFWKDIIRKPDVVTNVGGNNEAWKFLADNIPDRTEWNNWETRWSGTKKTGSGTESVRKKGWLGWTNWGRRDRTFSTYETSEHQQKTGIKTSFDTQIETESLGDMVVDSSVIPFMRAVPGGIRFWAKAMKPNALLYPFFDDTAVIKYIRPAVVYGLTRDDYLTMYENAVIGTSTITVNGEAVMLTGKTSDTKRVYFHLTPSDRDSAIYDNVSTGDTLEIDGDPVTAGGIVRVIDQNIDGAFRLKTDPTGSCSGIFDVPPGVFKTGTRAFKLTDSSTNIDGRSDTNADKDFVASGTEQVVQENIVSTRVPVLKKEDVKQTRTVVTGRSIVYSNSPTLKRWKDPIAQSFSVEANEYPSGLYLHSVDLWFTSADTTLPVSIRIVPMNNGYPNIQLALPFSEVTLNASDVNVTSVPRPDNYTRFKFSTPVYVQPGEYAVAILTNSLNYEVYTAVIGEQVLSATNGIATNRVMNEQPFSGLLFKSQNASTWDMSNEEDIMFRVNRVSFTIGSYVGRFDLKFDNEQLAALAPYKLSSSADHFEYDPAGTDSQFTYNLYKINVPEISDFEEVIQPRYSLKKSDINIVPGATSISQEVNFRETVVNTTKVVNGVKVIRNLSNNTDFQIEVNFGTTSDVVSPTIDEEQMNVIFIQNLIDDLEIEVGSDITIINPGSGYSVGDQFDILSADGATTYGQIQVDAVDATTSGVTDISLLNNPKLITGDTIIEPQDIVTGTGFDADIRSELDATGGISEARYISKIVNLKAGFESRDLKVTLSAYRPQGTAIYIYYKIKAAEDSGALEMKRWNLMYELSNPNEFSTEESDYLPLEFVTYRQRSDGTIDSETRGGAFYTDGGTTYEDFNSYRVKIVMTSNDTNRIPILQNLGGIALIDPIAP